MGTSWCALDIREGGYGSCTVRRGGPPWLCASSNRQMGRLEARSGASRGHMHSPRHVLLRRCYDSHLWIADGCSSGSSHGRELCTGILSFYVRSHLPENTRTGRLHHASGAPERLPAPVTTPSGALPEGLLLPPEPRGSHLRLTDQQPRTAVTRTERFAQRYVAGAPVVRSALAGAGVVPTYTEHAARAARGSHHRYAAALALQQSFRLSIVSLLMLLRPQVDDATP